VSLTDRFSQFHSKLFFGSSKQRQSYKIYW